METEKTIKEICERLLKQLQIKATVDLKQAEEIYQVTINTEESGLLIGYHGNTLNSFQLILQSLVFKKLAKWERIVVNVGDYRQKREETLRNMAQQYAEQVISTKEPAILPYFLAAERRIIHLALQDNPQVSSESTGEGKERRITIKLKQSVS